MRQVLPESRGPEFLGALIGLFVLLWGVNAAAIWVFDYPAIYCLGDALATETLHAWYRVIGFGFLLYLAIMAFARGVSTVPLNLACLLLYYMAPEWFFVLFASEGGCG